MKVAVISEKGDRSYMEDNFFIENNFIGKDWLFGLVADGHGGAYAANYFTDNLPQRFKAAYLEAETKRETYPEVIFFNLFQKLSIEIEKKDSSGAAALAFLIKNNCVFYANTGDCRAIVVKRNETARQLTLDHRTDVLEEMLRIEASGGQISNGYVLSENSGIMLTRSIGDVFFKQIGVIAQPQVGCYWFNPEDFYLVVASDGLFDVLKNIEIAEVCSNLEEPKEIVQALYRLSAHRYMGNLDNFTVIVVSLKG